MRCIEGFRGGPFSLIYGCLAFLYALFWLEIDKFALFLWVKFFWGTIFGATQLLIAQLLDTPLPLILVICCEWKVPLSLGSSIDLKQQPTTETRQ